MAIRLNRYISESGYCSRREADGLIASHVVTVNGEEGEYNTRVSPNDKVAIDGELVIPKRKIDFTPKEAPKSSRPFRAAARPVIRTESKPDFITRPSKAERVAAGVKGAKPKTGKSDENKPIRAAKPAKVEKPKPVLNGKKYVPKKKFI